MGQVSVAAMQAALSFGPLCCCSSLNTVAHKKNCSGWSLTVGSKGVTQMILSILQGPFAGDIGLDRKSESGQHCQARIAHLQSRASLLLSMSLLRVASVTDGAVFSTP